jgi:pSer/pThr/pTyr-binding forkhead associated (FHA) protein
MVQLKFLSGTKAGTSWGARRFPVRVGRAPNADLRLEEQGIWDEHLRIDFNSNKGYVLSTGAGALARINGEQMDRSTALRNGDVIELGSLRIQFWLGEPRQRGLRLREGLTWLSIALICLGQIGLIYWLLRE